MYKRQAGLRADIVGPCTRYAGVIQIQGNDLLQKEGRVEDSHGGFMLSSAWDQEWPLSAAEARSRLAMLMMTLSRDEKLNRYSTSPNELSAYERAVRYTFSCAANNGCDPPGRGFTNNKYEGIYNAPRIDMVISVGRNFK